MEDIFLDIAELGLNQLPISVKGVKTRVITSAEFLNKFLVTFNITIYLYENNITILFVDDIILVKDVELLTIRSSVKVKVQKDRLAIIHGLEETVN